MMNGQSIWACGLSSRNRVAFIFNTVEERNFLKAFPRSLEGPVIGVAVVPPDIQMRNTSGNSYKIPEPFLLILAELPQGL